MMKSRIATIEDVDALFMLAEQAAGLGMTSFKADRAALTKKVTNTKRTLNGEEFEDPTEKIIFIVLEDENGQVIGCAAIYPDIGDQHPCWRIERGHDGKITGLKRDDDFLKHAIEVGTLFVTNDDQHRGKGLGRFLSIARFLYIANDNAGIFNEEQKVIAQIAPQEPEDPSAQSFADLFTENFFKPLEPGTEKTTFKQADDYVAEHGYGTFFNEEVFEVAKSKEVFVEGNTTQNFSGLVISRDMAKLLDIQKNEGPPALKILESLGFQHGGYLDFHGGGPISCTKISEIDPVQNSVVSVLKETPEDRDGLKKHQIAIATSTNEDFSVVSVEGYIDDEGNIYVDDPDGVLGALGLEEGSEIRYYAYAEIEEETERNPQEQALVLA